LWPMWNDLELGNVVDILISQSQYG
jgi:hypothetical protein